MIDLILDFFMISISAMLLFGLFCDNDNHPF